MDTKTSEAREYIVKGRKALQRGDKQSAWQFGKEAARAAPQMEDAWLVLTASAPSPQQALAYARKVLEVHPESVRARRGLEWALAQMKQIEAGRVLVKQSTALSLAMNREGIGANFPKHVSPEIIPTPQSKINRENWLYVVLWIGAGCLMVGLVGFFALFAKYPALASVMSNVSSPVYTQENLWAPVDIAKPAIIPLDDGNVVAPQLADAPGNLSSDDAASTPTDIPTLAAAEQTIVTPEATETPGTMAMEIVDDNTLFQSVSPEDALEQYPSEGNGVRWIDVNLSAQRVSAYEGDTVVNSFVVSTGVAQTPTVTGKYKIYVKVPVQDMSGPGYHLRDVPSVMFFYDDYGLHGTYWHNNFGTPMSRGCVNLTIDDAAWLFNWASVGTVVNVHY